MEYSKATENQLDIMDEAIALMNSARTETYNLTFEQALEIVKVQKLENISNSIKKLSDVIFDYL